MATILTTGARVNSVDEEGEVQLFCYSLQRTFSFRIDSREAPRWGSMLGRALTITVHDENELDDLYECEACSAKPSAATLCRDCLERRKRAGALWKGPRAAKAKEGT